MVFFVEGSSGETPDGERHMTVLPNHAIVVHVSGSRVVELFH
jgi:hypothetical protein